MLSKQTVAQSGKRRFTVTRRTGTASIVLVNLMRDTSAPTLAFLAERYGLRRVPGLSRDTIIMRILRNLPLDQLAALEADLIAARYGALPVGDLVQAAVEAAAQGGRPAPRLDQISPREAFLVDRGMRRWAFTMRGHDVSIDIPNRTLACDCGYFTFAARRKALCKHLAVAFQLIPEVYARDALIELLVMRQYGDRSVQRWQFVSTRQAAAGE